jgi:hypothetical protein
MHRLPDIRDARTFSPGKPARREGATGWTVHVVRGADDPWGLRVNRSSEPMRLRGLGPPPVAPQGTIDLDLAK